MASDSDGLYYSIPGLNIGGATASTASVSEPHVYSVSSFVHTEPGWHPQDSFTILMRPATTAPVYAKPPDHHLGMPLELLIGVTCAGAIVRWHIDRVRPRVSARLGRA